MYRLKSFIENIGEDRIVNADIKVQSNTVYLIQDDISYKFEHGNWYQYTNHWVNLQGGVPMYTAEENIDDKLFEEINYEPRDF